MAPHFHEQIETVGPARQCDPFVVSWRNIVSALGSPLPQWSRRRKAERLNPPRCMQAEKARLMRSNSRARRSGSPQRVLARSGLLFSLLPLMALAAFLSVSGCKSSTPDQTAQNQATQPDPNPADPNDPANANLAPVSATPAPTTAPSPAPAPTPTAPRPRASTPAPAPYPSQEPSSGYDDNQGYSGDYSEAAYNDTPEEYGPEPPPPLPEYEQPPSPVRATSGPLAAGATAERATTGFRAPGPLRRMKARFGLPVTGDSSAAVMAFTTATGDATSASTAG